MSDQSRTSLFKIIHQHFAPLTSDNRDSLSWVEELMLKTKTEEMNIHLAMLEISKRSNRRHLIRTFPARDTATVSGDYGEVPVGEWLLDESIKVWFLSSLVSDQDAGYQALFSIYNQGDSETRVASLRALNFIQDDPSLGLELIYDAGRTYLSELMQAAWCNNPFTSEYLTTEEYRKAVLKALFCEIPIEGFLRLEERADQELARSLCEYANEREAAGRFVPHSIWIVSARFPHPGLVARLIGRLEHPTETERFIAASALKSAKDPRSISFIRERLEREESPRVIEVLQSICSDSHSELKS